jgi:integrase
LFDEDGKAIRGKQNRATADLALARVKAAGQWRPTAEPAREGEWLVAQVCSKYIEYCRRGSANGTISKGHSDTALRYLNELCRYCGALPVSQLRKGHVKYWIESHQGWALATQRNAIATILAAFNHAQATHDVPNPLRGLKKPPPQPRLHSLSEVDEVAMLGATDDCFRNFLFAAIRTGLRPFCELARLTADHVEETARGMMWRVYSTKTKKTRKIPIRPEIAQLTRRLLRAAPKGPGIPLFGNAQGRAWKPVTGRARFRKIKKKLGWDRDRVKRRYCCYSCRHTFAHRMLSGYWNGGAGCSIETLAELIGDTPKVAFDHYGREWGQHYQGPLWAAVGGGAAAPQRNAAEQASPNPPPKKEAVCRSDGRSGRQPKAVMAPGGRAAR